MVAWAKASAAQLGMLFKVANSNRSHGVDWWGLAASTGWSLTRWDEVWVMSMVNRLPCNHARQCKLVSANARPNRPCPFIDLRLPCTLAQSKALHTRQRCDLGLHVSWGRCTAPQ